MGPWRPEHQDFSLSALFCSSLTEKFEKEYNVPGGAPRQVKKQILSTDGYFGPGIITGLKG